MPSLEHPYIVHIYSCPEDMESQERGKLARFGDEYDENVYRGLRPQIIRELLDAVGTTGDNPLMATMLFHAGVEMAAPSRHELYDDEISESPNSPPQLFGVYLDAGRVQANAAPDALLLAQGYGRKAYRGYKTVVTDFWCNPQSPAIATVEREARDIAQQAMLSDYCHSDFLFVEQGTVIHEIMGTEKTVEQLGITPEDYAEGYGRVAAIDRMGRLGNIPAYRGQPELLQRFRDLYKTLQPDVESRGGEGEDLYELRLSESEIRALNTLQKLTGIHQITGLAIDREDRENHGEYWYRGDDDPSPFYTNGWGDMTVRLQLEFENIVKCYTLRVFMDSGRRETHLEKYTAELRQHSSWVAKEAGHMLASMRDPLTEETDFNEIDAFEYQDLLRLIRNIQAVTTLS